MDILFQLAATLSLMIIAFIAGTALEERHFKAIRRRENGLRNFLTTNLKRVPEDWTVESSTLVSGSVVVSLDYFKRIISSIRALLGGRLVPYETLLDRARREAVLRMQEKAKARGFDAIINTRLETSRLANANSRQDGVGGIEILVFGTAIKRSTTSA